MVATVKKGETHREGNEGDLRMPLFERYIAIDYSGAGLPTAPQVGIQVYEFSDSAIYPVTRDDGTNWSRESLAGMILGRLQGPETTIIGIDHAFSFPIKYFRDNGIEDWEEFLVRFSGQFPTHIEPVAAHRETIAAAGGRRDLRLTERWSSSAKSVFDFGPNGVAFSTAAGIPWLHHYRTMLRNRIHFWPFDGWDVGNKKHVVCEVYPAIFKNRFDVPPGTNVHQRDAYSTCKWLQDRDAVGLLEQYFHPQLLADERHMAALEGWMLGIM